MAGGTICAAIQAAPTAKLTAGTDANLDFRVVNLGRISWGNRSTPTNPNPDPQPAVVVGRWVPLSADAALPTKGSDQSVSVPLPIGLAPGKTVKATLGLTTPTAPGQNL